MQKLCKQRAELLPEKQRERRRNRQIRLSNETRSKAASLQESKPLAGLSTCHRVGYPRGTGSTAVPSH
jgi:hypothetical protein